MFGTSMSLPGVAVPAAAVDVPVEAPVEEAAVVEAPVEEEEALEEVGAEVAAPAEVVAVDRLHRRQEHLRCRCPSVVGPMMSSCDF